MPIKIIICTGYSLQYQLISFVMLKNLKKQAKNKKDGKSKKDETKKMKQPQAEEKEMEIDEEQADTNLVEIDYTKKDEKKAQVVKKQTGYAFEEKDLDACVKVPEIKKEEKVLDSWVPTNLEAALNFKNEFKLEEHLNDFQSLEDKALNEEIKKKVAQEPPKKEIKTSEEGMKTAVIEKTAQERKMQAAGNDDLYISNKPRDFQNPFQNTSIKETNLTFTNSSMNEEIKFKKMEKSKQELKFEQIEKKEQQQRDLKPNKDTWMGSTPKDSTQPAVNNIVIRDTPMMFTNSKSSKPNQDGEIKFAPLKTNQQQQGGMMFAPLAKEPKAGSRRMDMDDGLIFVSKKEQEERRKKREEKELEAQKLIETGKQQQG